MTAEINPQPAGREPARPANSRAKAGVDREIVERFATLVESRSGPEARQSRTMPRRGLFDLEERETAPAVDATPHSRIGDRNDQRGQSTGSDAGIARTQALTGAAEPPTLAGSEGADPSHVVMADRIAAPDRADAETLLAMTDTRWLAREAAITTQPGGALSLSLDLNANGEESNEAADELRRRLEARGLGIAEIRVRDEAGQFGGSK